MMTITREEFKELVSLFIEQQELFEEMTEYIQEEKAEEMVYPVFDWIAKKLKIDSDTLGEDMFYMLHSPLYGSGVAIDWEVAPDGNVYNVQYTRDLDLIYDKYIK